MKTSDQVSGWVLSVALGGFFTQIDSEAFFTIMLAFVLAMVCAYLTYKIAIRQVKLEIREAFAEHIKKMHSEGLVRGPPDARE